MVRYQGHVLAKELAEKELQTTVITDSAVFAMISRVNMVSQCIFLFLAQNWHCGTEALLT